MASSDYPMGSMSPTEESMYPDIDEALQYPWQGENQTIAEDIAASVIDPRLYQGSKLQDSDPAVGPIEEAYDDDPTVPAEPTDIFTDDDSELEYIEDSERYSTSTPRIVFSLRLTNNKVNRMNRMNTQQRMTRTTRALHEDAVAVVEDASQADMVPAVVKVSKEAHESHWNLAQSSRFFIRMPPLLLLTVIMTAPLTL